jgi:hypothetical protein
MNISNPVRKLRRIWDCSGKKDELDFVRPFWKRKALEFGDVDNTSGASLLFLPTYSKMMDSSQTTPLSESRM